eukprot:631212-Prorocentrum_minimum.AAC.1
MYTTPPFTTVASLYNPAVCWYRSRFLVADTRSPTTKAPTTRAPTHSPTTDAPTTRSPTTKAPTTKAPTIAPTPPGATASPTNSPTTASPTTAAPTTDAPTTAAPTTRAPTTSQPTTSPTFSAHIVVVTRIELSSTQFALFSDPSYDAAFRSQTRRTVAVAAGVPEGVVSVLALGDTDAVDSLMCGECATECEECATECEECATECEECATECEDLPPTATPAPTRPPGVSVSSSVTFASLDVSSLTPFFVEAFTAAFKADMAAAAGVPTTAVVISDIRSSGSVSPSSCSDVATTVESVVNFPVQMSGHRLQSAAAAAAFALALSSDPASALPTIGTTYGTITSAAVTAVGTDDAPPTAAPSPTPAGTTDAAACVDTLPGGVNYTLVGEDMCGDGVVSPINLLSRNYTRAQCQAACDRAAGVCNGWAWGRKVGGAGVDDGECYLAVLAGPTSTAAVTGLSPAVCYRTTASIGQASVSSAGEPAAWRRGPLAQLVSVATALAVSLIVLIT